MNRVFILTFFPFSHYFPKKNTILTVKFLPFLPLPASVCAYTDLHFEVDLRLVENYAYNFVNKDKAHPN